MISNPEPSSDFSYVRWTRTGVTTFFFGFSLNVSITATIRRTRSMSRTGGFTVSANVPCSTLYRLPDECSDPDPTQYVPCAFNSTAATYPSPSFTYARNFDFRLSVERKGRCNPREVVRPDFTLGNVITS